MAELNTGQLRLLLRSEFLVDCIGINKVQGKPFNVSELVDAIESHVNRIRKASKESRRLNAGASRIGFQFQKVTFSKDPCRFPF